MISKESFIKKLKVLGNQYANNIVLNSKNKDAKDIIISDGFNDIKEQDIIEGYVDQEVKQD